ncbi:MAG: MFS transporter [Anaerolineaceae bacterium]|nr:MFS transporter [Anaerolineaceae bacterium]
MRNLSSSIAKVRSSFFGERTVLPSQLSGTFHKAILFQICITAGFEAIFVLGALSAQRITGTDQIFGLASTTAFAFGQLAISLPTGRWMDRYGRKPVLFSGALVEATGLFLIGISIPIESQLLITLGLLLLGLGSGIAQMAYLIGGDIFPPARRAEGLGIMNSVIAVGVVLGPYLVGLIGDAATAINLDKLSTPWFVMGGLVAIAAWIMHHLKPEPLEVARKPYQYYPEIKSEFSTPESNHGSLNQRSKSGLFTYPMVASIGITFCFQGTRMSIIPLLTYILVAKGYSLTTGAIMVAAMGLGMVVAAIPSGHLGDRLGRKKPLLMAGVVGTLTAALIPQVASAVLIFILLFLMGAAFITMLTMTRVIITDVTKVDQRASAMAFSMIAVGIAVVIFPTVASYILNRWGWSSISWLSVILMSLALLQIFFLQEKGVGGWNLEE